MDQENCFFSVDQQNFNNLWWWSGIVVSALASIDEVNQRRAGPVSTEGGDIYLGMWLATQVNSA